MSEASAKAARRNAARLAERRDRELVRRYSQAWQRIRRDLDKTLGRIKDAQAAGTKVNPAWLQRAGRLKSLEDKILIEVRRYGKHAGPMIEQLQREAVKAGQQDAIDQVRAQLGRGARRIRTPDLRPVNRMIGKTQAGTKLAAHLTMLGPEAAENVTGHLIEGVAIGQNPTTTGKLIADGSGITTARAITLARTETMRVYRETSLATYRANPKLVKGWIWFASLDDRTCPMCIAMHGEPFPPSETLDTHPNCRCTMMPETFTFEELGLKGEGGGAPVFDSGPTWFDKQSAATQREILGPGRHQLYAEGKFQLGDVVQKTKSKTFGPGRRTKTLKELS